MNSKMEEIDLLIDNTGKVIIHVTGPQGTERTDRIQMVANLVGRLDETYHPPPHHHPEVIIVADKRVQIKQSKG